MSLLSWILKKKNGHQSTTRSLEKLLVAKEHTTLEELKPRIIYLSIHREGEQYAGGGILLTEDGYFLTARHCVENFSYGSITLGKTYEVEKVCVQSKALDLALVKADMLGPALPFPTPVFNVRKTTYHHIELPAKVLTMRDRRYDQVDCFVHNTMLDECIFSGDLLPGDSGAPLVTVKGELLAITTSASANAYNLGTPISRAMALVRQYVELAVLVFD